MTPPKVIHILTTLCQQTGFLLGCAMMAGCMTLEERIADDQRFFEQQAAQIDFGIKPDEQAAKIAALDTFAKSGEPVSADKLGTLRRGYFRRGKEIEYGWLISAGGRVAFFTKWGSVFEVSSDSAREL
jgi:hypothetical protein